MNAREAVSFGDLKGEFGIEESDSGNAYLEAFPVAGIGGIISYKVKVTNPGKYYIWGKAFSNGTEDNGLYVGLNEQWLRKWRTYAMV